MARTVPRGCSASPRSREVCKRKITIEDLLTMRSGLVDANRGYGAGGGSER